MRKNLVPYRKNRFAGSRRSPGKQTKSIAQIERYISTNTLENSEWKGQEQETVDFDTFEVSPLLLEAITRKGYQEATPIQTQAIPPALKGRDVIGVADTGTGKTAAFLIPLLERLRQKQLKKVLVLTPTRELALQIEQEFYDLTRNQQLSSVLVIGGTSIQRQQKKMQKPYQFMFGTVGRIMDLHRQKLLHFSEFDAIVLDEVDRMLDMGFIGDVKAILAGLSKPRQSLFFSATLPRSVEELCRTFLNNPVKVSIPSEAEKPLVHQEIIKLEDDQTKMQVLKTLLRAESRQKVLVFGRTRRGVKRLAQSLYKQGFAVDCLHGDKSQGQRQKALDRFRRSQISILVATDVAARGLDVPDITHVINYDIPETLEDYIHRVGRTGRAGKMGVALTLIG